MFRKLVSSLAFSPALIAQLGFYSRRLRKEQTTRRLGLVFTVFALVVQSFAVFSPVEQVSASTGSSIIEGGVSSVQELLSVYDAGARGQNDFKDFMDYAGITRDELASLSNKVVYVCSTDKSVISFGRQHRYSAAEGELVHNVPRQTGGFSTFYSVPLYRFDSVNNSVNCYDSYVGHSKALGWFSIMRKCGNLQIKTNVQKFPRGHFVAASCKTIQGFAYDERQIDMRVKVYLYFGGPPGKGKQFGPIMANQSTPTSPLGNGYGFSFAVPEEYQKSTSETQLWGVMQPLPGWNQSTVQFDNTLTIPGNCTPAPTPVVTCENITVNTISRTAIKIDVNSTASYAAIQGYNVTVTSYNGSKIYDKTFESSALKFSSEVIELARTGDYVVKVTIKSSIGDITSAGCEKSTTVSPPDKCVYSPTITNEDPNCKPCPYKTSIWINDENCVPTLTQAKEAKNLTSHISNANGTTAKPSDRIEYTIYTTNLSDAEVATDITEHLGDVLQYADITILSGGVYDNEAKKLSWNDVKIAANATDVRTFAVQVKSVIAATPRGGNDPSAYDCVMTNSYGNTIDINLQCPIEKTIETAVQQLPRTGATENVIFGSVLLMTVTYFYARSRQLNKEVRLIRKEFNSSTP